MLCSTLSTSIIKIDIYENNQEIRKMIIFDFRKINFIKLLKHKNNFFNNKTKIKDKVYKLMCIL